MIKKALFFFVFMIASIMNTAYAAPECVKVSAECIQGPETRFINGVAIYYDCWAYRDTFECVEEQPFDTCQPLRNMGCYETGVSCAAMNNGRCVKWDATMRCDIKPPTIPPGVTELPPIITITDTYDDSSCRSFNTDRCTLTGEVCIDGPGSKIINGESVYKSCWKWAKTYFCVNPNNTLNDCGQYASDSRCSLKTERCIHSTPSGTCLDKERIYTCMVQEGSITEEEFCKTRVCDSNGNCIDNGSGIDGDFGQAMASMEAARQIGNYLDPDDLTIFGGEASFCSKGRLGLTNCCAAKGGAQSNNGLGQALVSTGLSVASEVAEVGSNYVYDQLMSAEWIQNGYNQIISSINGITGSTLAPGTVGQFTPEFNPSFSYMGFSATFGSVGGGFMGGNMVIGSVGTGAGSITFAFNPYVLALTLLMDYLMTCSQDDAMTGMKKGADLCVHVGTYCKKKALGSCIERAEGHCCYNSKLARIVNEQGRAQIGKPWGSAENPQCDGFTISEFEDIDFSQIDFSEFIADLVAKQPDLGPGTARGGSAVVNRVENYFSSPTDLYLPDSATGNTHQTGTGNRSRESNQVFQEAK